jgi:hypothetical protein
MTFPIVNDLIVKVIPHSFHLLHFSLSENKKAVSPQKKRQNLLNRKQKAYLFTFMTVLA